jgi:hypothetical protein
MRKSQQLSLGLRLVRRIFEESQTYRNPNQNRASLWQIFSSNKSAPANRKKGFCTNRNPKAGGWIHYCMKRLRTLKSFQIFKSEIKKSKTYSG